MSKLRAGLTIRFVIDNLGAEREGWPGRVVDEIFGRGDVGTVAYKHPNRKACKDWWYVEVRSRRDPEQKLYVGILPRMVELVS